MLLENHVKGGVPGGAPDTSTPRRKTSSIDGSKSSSNFSPEKAAAAAAAVEEMQQITKEQADIALDLTKGRWESIGIEQSNEDKDDLHTVEACINRVTALFWIRLVAIGIVNSPTTFQQYCSLPLHDDDDRHPQPNRNTNMLYHTVDLSTTTICRKILQSPKEQPRNPQDVDDTDRINEEEDNINVHQHPDNEQHQRKTPSPSSKIVTSGPFKVPCWWWPNEVNESFDTISQDSSKYPVDGKEYPSSGTTSVDTRTSKRNKSNRSSSPTAIQPWEIFVQLRLFVQRILQNHHLNDLPFHNYTHATSVVLRCNKLLDMMLCTIDESQSSFSDPVAGGSGDDNNSYNTGFRPRLRNSDYMGSSDNEIHSISHNNSIANLSVSNSLNSNNNNMYNMTQSAVPADMNYYYGDDSHRYDEDLDLDGRRFPPTFGIRRDPIVQFALLFAGLIHDVAHQGVTNRQLCNEEHPLAILYNDQSVQEKNSLRIAFEEFLKPNYEKLRSVMFGGEATENSTTSKNLKYRHFRQTIVHSVLTTDIASPEQTVITKSKWKEAFYAYNARLSAYQYQEDNARRFGMNDEQQLSLHGNFPPAMQQYKVPLAAMNGRRRGSLVSEISMPQMSRKYNPLSATDPTPYNANWKPGPAVNRRGSNVSGITEVTDDSYFRNQRQYSRRGSATGRQYMSGGYRTRGSMTGALPTVPSQRQLDTQTAHRGEYDTSAYVESGEMQSHHAKIYDQLPPVQASIKYIPGPGGRRGSYLSTYSVDSIVLMHQQQHHSHNKARRHSMTQKFQQQQMRRMSSDDSNSFLYPSRASTEGQSGPHFLQSRRSSNESFQQYVHRRASNESMGGQQYLMNNASNDVDEYSYEGSEFGNDSAALYNRKPSLHGSSRRLNRRMSNGSADSYSASEWGGDSVAKRVPGGQDTDDDNEGVIQHRRYPHPEFQSDSNLLEPPTLNTRQVHRSFSLDASSAGTFNSLLANSIEVNKKRLDDDVPDCTNAEVKMHSVRKIMMETEDGDAIDISRYLWSEDNDGSMSITPPSSVEDEYGGYAAEYAARFKSPHLAQHTPDDSMANLDQQQIPKNSSHQDSSNGEYCGRVIVATTTTDKPIDRRSSVSGAITSSSHYLTSNYGNPTVPSLDSKAGTATGNAIGMNQPPPVKRRIINRRASTGTVPLRSSGAVSLQQGGRIDENSRMSYGHSLRVNGNGRRRRGSMGTITSYDYPSSTVAHHSQESESVLLPSDIRSFKKRLGIRRSMDLSGESIEFYPRHEESDIMSVVTDDEMMIQWVDLDETDDLRAAVVIEALLRVADVGHSLQNWESMIMWSTKLFHELCNANENDRGHDPRVGWYDNQIRIMDSYLRPLALQLDEMGVFGEFNGILFVQCVDKIRKRWVLEGQAVTETLCEEAETRKANSAIDLMRFL